MFGASHEAFISMSDLTMRTSPLAQARCSTVPLLFSDRASRRRAVSPRASHCTTDAQLPERTSCSTRSGTTSSGERSKASRSASETIPVMAAIGRLAMMKADGFAVFAGDLN